MTCAAVAAMPMRLGRVRGPPYGSYVCVFDWLDWLAGGPQVPEWTDRITSQCLQELQKLSSNLKFICSCVIIEQRSVGLLLSPYIYICAHVVCSVFADALACCRAHAGGRE